MIYNVITPMNRPENIESMIQMLEPKNIQWHVITDVGSSFKYKFNEEWIHHYECPNFINLDLDHFDRYYNVCNWGLSNITLNPEEMYCFLSDDDAYEPNFFHKIDLSLRNVNWSGIDVIIVSMERGSSIPWDATTRYPTSKLVAHPDNVVVNNIGGEQFLISGSLLNQNNYRFPLHHQGDGLFIQQIYNENKEKTLFCPEANVWFNYFEPGRWDK
jgi:hypothetical protein